MGLKQLNLTKKGSKWPHSCHIFLNEAKMFLNCHTRPQRTNSTQSISASAEELGPLGALFSRTCLAVRPSTAKL